jgi:hypothetical protein
MKHETNSLIVKQSTIPNAGCGLFAKRDFKRDELIGYFKGNIISMTKANKIDATGDIRRFYFVDLENGKILDVYDSPSLAKYANDAEGITRIDGLANNAVIGLCNNGKMAYIKAQKLIPEGAEIFLEYGKEYWETLNMS